jgi:hypothetical protein
MKKKKAKGSKKAAEQRRQNLLRFLASKAPAVSDLQDPEAKEDSAAWVHKLRRGG